MKENSIEFKVYGKYALFSDPVTRVGGEKFTYQIPTYQALKGVCESIYWKPTIQWFIDKVRIIKPIQTQSQGVRPINFTGGNTLSIYTYLKDVEYQVKAHFEWNENRPDLVNDRNENKHHNIAKRMLERGGRRDIYLGTRECQAYVEPCEFSSGKGHYDNIDELSFGLMLHGITYADEAVTEAEKGHMTIRLWTPVMKKGIIEFIRPEDCTIRRIVGDMKMKHFGEGNFIGLDEFTEEGDLIGMDECTL
ncbi:type I-C CRISPR-associated protein Cas5 [Lachnospiraceae bacterium MD1]|uniref:pre-crRNA processing endonuclease n=1 Tax=Variimorphobacter saccharofermentans TaxID=2755051 RepID=A0A839K569_9FIRM|nr:type I-C CRISPR-associated protein Cas5c [Variimorphobacter saccharofermentans]MBB2184508.1 type I-C CRISPR-associated protein Cas5 [Variimorphobacter saccharofermentans]